MKYRCKVCGYEYDEEKGIPDKGIPAGTKWSDLPDNWTCPLCGAAKSMFEAEGAAEEPAAVSAPVINTEPEESMHEMTFGELSAMCSNLELGCDKQQLQKEKELFGKLADYFEKKAGTETPGNQEELLKRVNEDLSREYVMAKQAAEEAGDRGAKRILVWSEKVTALLNALLNRYGKEGTEFIKNTKVYVCDICGFVYVGDVPPAICPICKVPSFKILEVERS